MQPVFFPSVAELRHWLEQNHHKEKEICLGFYKKAAGRPNITYAEALDEMLAYGWIDGVIKGIDKHSYMRRWTPRKKRSIWSNVNIKRVVELMEMGRMKPEGIVAFENRKENLSGIYSYENETRQLSSEEEALFKANHKAWEFFQAQSQGYRKIAFNWVVSSKKEETRKSRMQTLINDSEAGRKIPSQRYGKKPASSK